MDYFILSYFLNKNVNLDNFYLYIKLIVYTLHKLYNKFHYKM